MSAKTARTGQAHGLGDLEFPNAGTMTSSPAPTPAALSIATVPMPRMLVGQRERQVTHNKKELVPEPKFGDQLF